MIHVYEVRPRTDKRGVDLISDVLPFGRLWYGKPNAVANAIGYAKHGSRSHYAVIRVYDDAGNVIETHEHKGDFKVGDDFPVLHALRRAFTDCSWPPNGLTGCEIAPTMHILEHALASKHTKTIEWDTAVFVLSQASPDFHVGSCLTQSYRTLRKHLLF